MITEKHPVKKPQPTLPLNDRLGIPGISPLVKENQIPDEERLTPKMVKEGYCAPVIVSVFFFFFF